MTARLRRAVAGTLWYVREVMGENAYDHYLAHQRRDHPDEPVLSRREFECRRMDQLEIRPGQRCCQVRRPRWSRRVRTTTASAGWSASLG